jgi:hypothetical protein
MARQRQLTLGTVAMMAVLGAGLFAAKPPQDIPLLVSFGAGTADALRSDGYLAPGFQADYANGLENVLAVLQTSGNFRFFMDGDMQLPPLRSLCFDFGTQLVPFPAAQCVHANQPMHAYPVNDVAIQNLRYGQSVRKLTRFTWQDSTNYIYRLGYGTDMDMNGVQDSPAVRVTCTAPANTSVPCTNWVLAPESDGTAALFRFPLKPGKRGTVIEGSPEWIGNYTMPFVQTLTLKP